MSDQKSRGGIGSHKHGVSGHSGPSPRQRLGNQLETNQRLDEIVQIKKKQRPKMVGSVTELMGIKRKKV